jgi:hypothetical protein
MTVLEVFFEDGFNILKQNKEIVYDQHYTARRLR